MGVMLRPELPKDESEVRRVPFGFRSLEASSLMSAEEDP